VVRVEAWFTIAAGLLKGATVLEIGGGPYGPKRVIADLGADAGRRGATADHCMGVCLRQARAGECRGQSCGTAAPWDRPAVPGARYRQPDRSRGYGGMACRAACRPSRAVGPTDGGLD